MPTPPPPSEPDPRHHVADQLRRQSRSCAAMGSPLYAALLARAAEDVEAGGPVWEVMSRHVAPGRGDAAALRLMAAVHRLVLAGRAPSLAEHYPSVGGGGRPQDAWEAFRATVAHHAAEVAELVALPCQTNEVGRCAALAAGFLNIAADLAQPLRLLEVGASAGLNLRWDHFRYGGGGVSWGPAGSPVDLTGHWRAPPPDLPPSVAVVERAGCDPRPVDPATEAGRLTLRASVWADQVDRLDRLEGAFRVAAAVPAQVDRASLDAWLPDRLDRSPAQVTTVVFHSIVDEYLAGDVRARFHRVLAEAGAQATPEAPLAWLRLEPATALRSHAVTLTTWPGGQERLLATCGAHGTDVTWRR